MHKPTQPGGSVRRRARPRSAARSAADPVFDAAAHRNGAASPRFKGRSVLVTGGASGIGRAIAAEFAAAGAQVTILDRDRAKGEQTLAQLRPANPGARFLHLDLKDSAAVERAGEAFSGAGGADILINNAAMIGRIAPFPELDPAESEEVIRVNLLGPLRLSQLAARHLIARGAAGTIVNILAIQTTTPVPGYSAYIASKGAMDALTLAMAVDLAPHRIRVNGIEVGSVLSENYLNVLPEKLKRAGARRKDGGGVVSLLDESSATLLGRMGRPVEIARIALFLASDDASYLTGSIVRADGGRLISRKVEPLL